MTPQAVHACVLRKHSREPLARDACLGLSLAQRTSRLLCRGGVDVT